MPRLPGWAPALAGALLAACVSPKLSVLGPDYLARVNSKTFYQSPDATYRALGAVMARNGWKVSGSTTPAFANALALEPVSSTGAAVSEGTRAFLKPYLDAGDVEPDAQARFKLDFSLSGASTSLTTDLLIRSSLEVYVSSTASWAAVDPALSALAKSYGTVFDAVLKESGGR